MAAFATVADLRTFMDDQSLAEARAQLILDAVSDEIRDALGWSVTEETGVTVTLDGSGDTDLLLPTLHLTAVTSVVEDGTVLVADDDFLIYRHGKLTRVTGGQPIDWTDKRQGVVSMFTHGYPAGAVPGVFRTVTLETAGRMWDNPGGRLKSKAVGRVSLSYADVKAMVPPIEDPRLDFYRLPEGF